MLKLTTDGTEIEVPAGATVTPAKAGAYTHQPFRTRATVDARQKIFLRKGCEDCNIGAMVDANTPRGSGVLPHIRDAALATALWAKSEEMTGVAFRP